MKKLLATLISAAMFAAPFAVISTPASAHTTPSAQTGKVGTATKSKAKAKPKAKAKSKSKKKAKKSAAKKSS